MDRLIAVTLIGFICGMVGTGMGGFLGFFLRKPSNRFMSLLLGFTSGIMLAVVCFDLLPESFKKGSVWLSFIGITAGCAAIIFIDRMIPTEGLLKKSVSKRNGVDSRFIKSGILMGIGIALHNFPEGLAVGSGFAASDSLGLGLTLVIGLHDLPEGIAVAAPLVLGGVNKFKILLYTILAGIPMGIGAFIGELLGQISPNFIGLCLSFAGGAMMYITIGELIPKSQNLHRGRLSTIGMIVGIMCGIYICSVF